MGLLRANISNQVPLNVNDLNVEGNLSLENNLGIGVDPDFKLQVHDGPIVVSGSQPFFMNSRTVSESFRVPLGYNAVSSGPITIADNVTVTISSNSSWSIV